MRTKKEQTIPNIPGQYVEIDISGIKPNPDNPRTITPENFNKLIDSILVFPKMLYLRPIVVNGDNVAIGGNMRARALQAIAKMDYESLVGRLVIQRDYQRMTNDQRAEIMNYWAAWLECKRVDVFKAGELTADEIRQFIIKDNAAFGSWDFDALANIFDEADLDVWGVNVWQMNTSDVAAPNEAAGTNTQADSMNATEAKNEANNEAKTPYQEQLITCPHCGRQFLKED